MSISHISFKKKLALNLYRRYRYNESKLHKPGYIFWECTLRCNLKCLHCGSDCSVNSESRDMPAVDFFSALDQLSEIIESGKTMIVLTGGEPLLRKDIAAIGRKLYLKGFPWGLVTNGMLLSAGKLKSLVDAGLRAITISLDGLEESHNWLRSNHHSFQYAMNAASLLPAVTNLNYDIVSCVNRRNFNELDRIRDVLINMGIREWRIFTIFPVGRAAGNPELQLDAADFKALFEFIKKTRQEGKILLNYGCEGFLGEYEGEVRDNFFFCRAGITIASILADGSISACPSLRSNFIQGNIYTDNFAEVWVNRYQKFRDKSWTKTGICAGCKSYDYCQGNGMHLREEKTGDLLFCHLRRIEEGERTNR